MFHSCGVRRFNARTSAQLAAASLISLLTACGGGGGSYGGGATSSMTPLTPTITISVAPTTIVAGQSATVTWLATNALACTASGGWSGNPIASGTQTVTPTTSGTVMFTLMCTAPAGMGYAGGGGGSATQSASLTVTPQTQFVAKSLVTDTAGGGGTTVDPNLLNPWGLVFGTGKPVWIANNDSLTSTLYDGNGTVVSFGGNTLPVQLPPDANNNDFDPTGIVYNSSTTDFVVTGAGRSGVALFIYAGESGSIGGWSPAVFPKGVAIAFTATDGASYKGLAIATRGAGQYLYAADFHNNKVDMIDNQFRLFLPPGSPPRFVDPTLPAGYAPFGIVAIPNGPSGPNGTTQLYVTYAKQGDGGDNADGAGWGLVDIFDTDGAFVKHLIPVGGALNAPWGLALAPGNFGTLSNTLLVGNFGDGKINAYDPATGAFIGTLTTAAGPFQMSGLWGIAFGNGAANQPTNTLYFTAGPNAEANGVYGRLDLPAM